MSILGVESAMPTGTSVAASSGVSETTSTPVAETPAHVPPEGAVGVAATEGEVPAAEVPAYQPNLKFKVLDKEKEFDEWAKGAVKDLETEKKVRELYEKAHGLDSVKTHRETLKTELAEVRTKAAETDKAIETIGSYAKAKDWDSFFEALSIPKNDILQYALALVQREQMPPEQRQQWEASRQAQQQAKYYQEQNQTLQQQQQQFEMQQRKFELSQEISKPENSALVQTYNAGMGNPGAFEDYVIRIGVAHEAQGKTVPVQQAVEEAIRHLRAVNPNLGMPAQQGLAPGQVASQVVTASNKPVLPNIQGRGTSAIKSTVRSLDDLRQKAKEMGR